MTIETEKLIAEIIANEMGMDFIHPTVVTKNSSNYFTIYNQNFVIPNTQGLFGCVEFLNTQTISTSNKLDGTDEVQFITVLENLMIDLFSFSDDARQRKHEIIFALNSIYSQQQQEEHAFKIFPISGQLSNKSRAEKAEMLNRYSIMIKIYRNYKKIISHADDSNMYYDTFGTDVYDEKHLEEGVPLITLEFLP